MSVSDAQLEINESVLSRMRVLAKNRRLAHAYLFVGPADVGKSATAIAVAKLLNCELFLNGASDMFCNSCPSCRKIDSGNHPDVHLLQGGFGQVIKIDDIRSILSQSRLRAFQSELKIFIITNIENLSQESGNALLKTLEEPSRGSLLLLTTSMPARVMATVKSRCQVIHFYPLSVSMLASRLEACYDRGVDDINFLAHFAEGCFGRAKRFKEKDIFKIKNEIIDTFILSYNSDAFIEKICKDKERMKEFLDILLCWVRDCLLLKAGAGEGRNLANLDRLHELRQFHARFSFEELEELSTCIIGLRRLLSENLSLKAPVWFLREKIWAR